MKHKQEGLARPCTSNDIFLVKEGLQCGNCLVVFPEPPIDEEQAKAEHAYWLATHNS